MGTVGGNLFAPSPFGDLAVALLALDATVSVQSGYGAARASRSRNFSPDATATPAPLVLGVSLPARAIPRRSAIAKSRE